MNYYMQTFGGPEDLTPEDLEAMRGQIASAQGTALAWAEKHDHLRRLHRHRLASALSTALFVVPVTIVIAIAWGG